MKTYKQGSSFLLILQTFFSYFSEEVIWNKRLKLWLSFECFFGRIWLWYLLIILIFYNPCCFPSAFPFFLFFIIPWWLIILLIIWIGVVTGWSEDLLTFIDVVIFFIDSHHGAPSAAHWEDDAFLIPSDCLLTLEIVQIREQHCNHKVLDLWKSVNNFYN